MSGGHWEYADARLMGEIFGWTYDNVVPDVFEDIEISNLVYDVFNLLHNYDWYISYDTSEETWLRQKNEFKKKWLGKNSRQRTERFKVYIDNKIEDTRQYLYKCVGVEDDD